MKARIEFTSINPKYVQALLAVQALADHGGLDKKMLNLVKMRASQLNRCAYCLDMHSKEARAAGETEQRLYGLEAWREAPYYSDKERAALEWTEAVTVLQDGYVPDSVYESVRAQFTESEITNLTLGVAMINVWNRLNVSLRTVPGSYRVGMFKTAGAQ